MSKPHMMKEVVTSEPCMLAMMQCQPRNMMIYMAQSMTIKEEMTLIHKVKPMTMKEERLFHTQTMFKLEICGI